jgi:protein SYS1
MAGSNIAPDPLYWWSPRKIILQILLLQLSYIITATLLITFLVLVMGAPFRVDYIFLDSRFRNDNVFGWSLSFLSILTSVFTSVLLIQKANLRVLFLVLLVRRSQLVIDFALTLQFFQLLFTTWYNWHFPTSFLWWCTKGVETAIMIMGGRYFCRMRELKPIEFGIYEMVSTDPEQGNVEHQNQNGIAENSDDTRS